MNKNVAKVNRDSEFVFVDCFGFGPFVFKKTHIFNLQDI